MFEDKQTPVAGGVPSNLPMEEPTDIFSGTDNNDIRVPEESLPLPPESAGPPSALSAGVLRPKNATDIAPLSSPASPKPVSLTPEKTIEAQGPMVSSALPSLGGGNVPPVDMSGNKVTPELYPTRGPVLSRGIMTTIIVFVVLIIILGGGWWVYSAFVRSQSANTFSSAPQPIDDAIGQPVGGEDVPSPSVESPTQPVADETTPADTTTDASEVSEQVQQDIGDRLLLGAPVDFDGDGLHDDEERRYGTNIEDWDSDDDELSDGDEVIVWKTDPLQADTDGDGYKDGEEVKAGYSPIGPGRFFEVPAEIPTADVTNSSS